MQPDIQTSWVPPHIEACIQTCSILGPISASRLAQPEVRTPVFPLHYKDISRSRTRHRPCPTTVYSKVPCKQALVRGMLALPPHATPVNSHPGTLVRGIGKLAPLPTAAAAAPAHNCSHQWTPLHQGQPLGGCFAPSPRHTSPPLYKGQQSGGCLAPPSVTPRHTLASGICMQLFCSPKQQHHCSSNGIRLPDTSPWILNPRLLA